MSSYPSFKQEFLDLPPAEGAEADIQKVVFTVESDDGNTVAFQEAVAFNLTTRKPVGPSSTFFLKDGRWALVLAYINSEERKIGEVRAIRSLEQLKGPDQPTSFGVTTYLGEAEY